MLLTLLLPQVAAFLEAHPTYVPDGWPDRQVPKPLDVGHEEAARPAGRAQPYGHAISDDDDDDSDGSVSERSYDRFGMHVRGMRGHDRGHGWGWDEEEVEEESEEESLLEAEEDEEELEEEEDEEEEQEDEIEEVSEEEDFDCLEYEQLLEAKLHPSFVAPRVGVADLADDSNGDWTNDSDDDSGSKRSRSERDVGWMRRRHASLAGAFIRLADTPRARRGALSSSSSGSHGSEESDGSVRRVLRCFQDDDVDRSDCSSASESAEVADAAFARHGLDHFWQNGPYIKYSRWRRHRLPTPEQPEPDLLQLMSTPTMDSLDEVAVPAAVREAVSRLGAGFEPNTDFEFLVEELLLTGAQVAVAELAKTCDGNGAMLLEAAEMEAEMENTLRPLLSYADL
jgi:hypothetical protein